MSKFKVNSLREVRCIDGRAMRHDPQPDDPYLETDVGVCEKCDGEGCEAVIARELAEQSASEQPKQIHSDKLVRRLKAGKKLFRP